MSSLTSEVVDQHSVAQLLMSTAGAYQYERVEETLARGCVSFKYQEV